MHQLPAAPPRSRRGGGSMTAYRVASIMRQDIPTLTPETPIRSAVAQLVEKAVKRTKCEILENLLEVIPYRIHAILTDNGV